MKPIPSFIFLLTFCCFFTPAYGDSLREIELVDGSVIRAQVLSMDGKTYRLHSETFGEVNIPEYRVKAIRMPQAQNTAPQQRITTTPAVQSQNETVPTAADTSPIAPTSPTLTTPSTGDLQQAFSQDPAAMNKIFSLQDDPLVQEILRDDRLMQAIHSGNLGALVNDPKIRALMSHPAVQDLGSQYGR